MLWGEDRGLGGGENNRVGHGDGRFVLFLLGELIDGKGKERKGIGME